MIKKWDIRFIRLAEHISSWSKDDTKVGAVVVDDNGRIISTGYNGFPAGFDDSRMSEKPYEKVRMIHAEMNAIANAREAVRGNTIYITHPPCNECAKNLVAFGIKRVVCNYDPRMDIKWTASTDIFAEAGIELMVINDE